MERQPPTDKEKREAKLAEALRANLRRRKAARSTDAGSKDGGEG